MYIFGGCDHSGHTNKVRLTANISDHTDALHRSHMHYMGLDQS